jgi:hypothetical protein
MMRDEGGGYESNRRLGWDCSEKKREREESATSEGPVGGEEGVVLVGEGEGAEREPREGGEFAHRRNGPTVADRNGANCAARSHPRAGARAKREGGGGRGGCGAYVEGG